VITLPVLESGAAKLRLVPMALSHVDALAAAATADRSTFGLAPIPRDRDSTQRYVERALADQEANRCVPFVAEVSGKIVGSYRLMSLEWWTWPEGPINVPGEPRVVGRDPPDVAEIGHVWLSTAAQRKAVNAAALILLMQQAFDVWRVHRLIWKTDARNERSRNVMVRLGIGLEGIMRAHTPSADGGIRDVALYSIIPAEWPAVRAKLEAVVAAAR
jgi:N-acetyltransferase